MPAKDRTIVPIVLKTSPKQDESISKTSSNGIILSFFNQILVIFGGSFSYQISFGASLWKISR